MSLAGAMEEIAAALDPLRTEIPELQVYPYLNPFPTPPSLDIYPSAPFQTGAGFGVGNSQVFFAVRARVSTADHEAAMKLLLRMMDPNDPASVEAAIADTAAVTPEGVSEFREYLEDTAGNGRLLGCEWRVSLFLEDTPAAAGWGTPEATGVANWLDPEFQVFQAGDFPGALYPHATALELRINAVELGSYTVKVPAAFLAAGQIGFTDNDIVTFHAVNQAAVNHSATLAPLDNQTVTLDWRTT